MAVLVDDLLLAAAASGLPGSMREFPETMLPEQRALDLVRAAERLRIAGFLCSAVRRGVVSLPPVAVTALDEARVHESTTRLYLEQELLELSAVLDDAEIEYRVLDGCAVAHVDYRDPEARAITRLDLLVQPRGLGRATDVLRRRGWRPPKTSDGRTGRGVPLVGPSGPRLVLHDGIPELSLDPGQLWADGDSFILSGRRLKALGAEQRLLHTSASALCPNEALSLLPQRDLVEMVLFGHWRRPRLMELALSWHAEGVLARAVHTAWQRLAIADVTGLSVWAEAHRTDPGRNPRRHPVDDAVRRRTHRTWARLRTRLARRP